MPGRQLRLAFLKDREQRFRLMGDRLNISKVKVACGTFERVEQPKYGMHHLAISSLAKLLDVLLGILDQLDTFFHEGLNQFLSFLVHHSS